MKNSTKADDIRSYLKRQDTKTLERFSFFIWTVLMERQYKKNPPKVVVVEPQQQQELFPTPPVH